MAKIIDIHYKESGRERHIYSDVEYVQGLLDDPQVQYALYRHWVRYFNDHASAEFFHLEDHRLEIIHNAYEVLWMKVRAKKIYVEDGILKGKNGEPFSSTLTTYMMSVAKRNNKELVRDVTKMLYVEDLRPHKVDCDDDDLTVMNVISSEPIEESPFLIPAEEQVMRDIVAEFISNMSERCSQILTMFYYQEMKLDTIMENLHTFKSKDALKTAKNKCMDRLKVAANQKYKEYLNS